MTLEIGQPAPDFSAPTNQGKNITLSSQKGKKIVLYFYPKDDTPGCTKEACGFRDLHGGFQQQNAVIIGVSKDTIQKHQKFIDKYDLPFTLVSDEAGKICEAYGVWVEKSMYGRKYFGIERATFLIDETGKIEKIWRKVKVTDHVEEVLATLS